MGTIVVFTKAYVVFNKRVLIIKRSEYSKTGKCEWETPGGRLEFGETPIECLRREVMEETNLTVDIDKLLYATSVLWPDSQGIGLIYLCKSNSDLVNLSDEHTEYLWATKAQFVSLINKKIIDEYHANSIFDILDID